MTYSYEQLVSEYKKQGRINRAALELTLGADLPTSPYHTLEPAQEFIIDLCAWLNPWVAVIVKDYTMYADSEQALEFISDTVKSGYISLSAVWKGQGRPMPVVPALESGQDYVNNCLNELVFNTRRKNQSLIDKLHYYVIANGHGGIDVDYPAIIKRLPRKRKLSDNELEQAVEEAYA